MDNSVLCVADIPLLRSKFKIKLYVFCCIFGLGLPNRSWPVEPALFRGPSATDQSSIHLVLREKLITVKLSQIGPETYMILSSQET